MIANKRILAALASLIVIVEAGGRFSAYLTAQIAGELGHDIAVVPCRPTDPGGRRVFGLLRDGAHPVASVKDVLELIGDGIEPAGWRRSARRS